MADLAFEKSAVIVYRLLLVSFWIVAVKAALWTMAPFVFFYFM